MGWSYPEKVDWKVLYSPGQPPLRKGGNFRDEIFKKGAVTSLTPEERRVAAKKAADTLRAKGTNAAGLTAFEERTKKAADTLRAKGTNAAGLTGPQQRSIKAAQTRKLQSAEAKAARSKKISDASKEAARRRRERKFDLNVGKPTTTLKSDDPDSDVEGDNNGVADVVMG
ncbi:hypothetical protein HK101_008357 [Irineochytrium annulatum]|nr:hypothetical protein HK101_008357 [Irineochytrium annulatum]